MSIAVPYIHLRMEKEFIQRFSLKQDYIIQNTKFIGGEEVSKLESTLKKYLNVNFAISCANGTDALQIALRSVGVGQGDIVFIPDLTFWATFESVVNVGARPCTVDICKKDLQIDFELFVKACKELKPKAAIIAHLYGWGSENLSKIRDFCREEGIFLVEDGAQCFGTLYNNKPIYEESLISTTSFYPAKVFGAAGDAGAVFTNKEEIASIARALSNHGRATHYTYEYVGWNSRMDSFQAAYLNEAFPFLEKKLKSRRDTILWYLKLFSRLDCNIVQAPSDYLENGYCNVILMESKERREKFQTYLKEKQIGFANIYPSPMSEQIGAKNYLYKKFGGQNSKEICESIINLPIFPYMSKEELNSIEEALRDFF